MAGVPGMRDGLPNWAPELKPCGTLAAYRRHHRRGEPVCDLCREEYNRYNRERRRPQPTRTHLARTDGRAFCGSRIGAAPGVDVDCVRCLEALDRHLAPRVRPGAAPPELPRQDTAA